MCGGDDDDAASSVALGVTESAGSSTATAPASVGTVGTSDGDAVVAGAAFPADRCAANEAAGTITYLSGFDFAATASIVDVVVAEQAGYYDDLCLDVELKPSFSTSNDALIAGGEAEIASGGSFSEVVDYATANDVEVVAVDVEGRAAIDSLIVKPGGPTTLEEVAGTTIGVKGKIPVSVAAMLAGAGLVEGTDYETVLLDGFDPIAHYNLDGIVGFPGYKSNEPGQLERAGLPFTLFDPTEYDVPGSFGVLFTTRAWSRPTWRPPGLPAGDDEGPRRRPRRSGGGDADRRRPRRGEREPELPVARGRVVPVGHGLRAAAGADPDGDYGVPDLAALQAGVLTPTPPSASSAARRPTPPGSPSSTPSPAFTTSERGDLAVVTNHPSVWCGAFPHEALGCTKHSDVESCDVV